MCCLALLLQVGGDVGCRTSPRPARNTRLPPLLLWGPRLPPDHSGPREVVTAPSWVMISVLAAGDDADACFMEDDVVDESTLAP